MESFCSKSGAHVLLAPPLAFGHSIAFFFLAPRLVQLGVRVTFLMVEGMVPQLQNVPLWASHWNQVPKENIEVVAVKDGFSQLGNRQGFFTMIQESSEPQLVAAYSDAVAALMSSTRFPAPCCIIADMLMGWTQEVAAKFNIPSYMLHIQSAANLSLMLHVPTLIAEGRLPLTASNQEKPVHIPGLKVPLRTSELPDDLHPGALISGADKIFLRTSWRVKQAPIVLVNTFRELEEDVFEALDALHANTAMQEGGYNSQPFHQKYISGHPRFNKMALHYVRKPSRASRLVKMPKVIPVGPLLPSPLFSKSIDNTETNNEADESIMRFLDKHPPRTVVYVAFGSVPMLNMEKLFEEAALGLEASGQPFLWAEATVNNPNATSLALSLPPGFVERTKERSMILNASAPQLRILQHPSTGAFLSHCGWNSVIESIAGGVPILASPLRADQKMNARFMVDVAKVAVEFQHSNESDLVIPRDEVERVVRLVFQEETGKVLRSNLESLKQSAQKNTASLENLKGFLAFGGCGSQCNPDPAMSEP